MDAFDKWLSENTSTPVGQLLIFAALYMFRAAFAHEMRRRKARKKARKAKPQSA
jgi:hypothetical protein